MRNVCTLAVPVAALFAFTAAAKDLEGVKVPETATVAGKELKLNGAGVRTKFFFKVYVWSLYFEQPPRAKSEAISSNCIKRLQLRFLRHVSRDQLVDAFRDGLARNAALRHAVFGESGAGVRRPPSSGNHG